MFQPSIRLISVLLLVGTAQGLFLALALFNARERNKTANRYLAFLLVVLSISLIDGFLTETNYYAFFPSLIGLEWPTNFLYGPLIYFYIKSLTGQNLKIPILKVFLHLIPSAALFVYLTPLYLANKSEKIHWWALTGGEVKSDTVCDIDPLVVLVVVQMLTYLVVCLRLIANYTAEIEHNFSCLDKIRLSWLKNLILVFISLCCMYIFFTILSPFYGIYREAGYLLHLSSVVVIFVMGYRGLRYPEVFAGCAGPDSSKIISPEMTDNKFNDTPQEIKPEHFPEKGKKKYGKSSLTSEQAEEILANLNCLMAKERPFLEASLTLPELADMLSVSTNHLSQVINEKLEKSFFDFVNEYRVMEAKKLLVSLESSRFSVLDIAMEAGFNSKSSFYSAFKKHTGVTPSQFKGRCAMTLSTENPAI